jgi:hypothetical protein
LPSPGAPTDRHSSSCLITRYRIPRDQRGRPAQRGEYTGPARWEFAPHVYLRRATVDSLEFYNVHFAGVVDLSGATLRSKDIYTASFTEVVGGS